MANVFNRLFRRNDQQLVAASAIPFGAGGYHRGHADVYVWQILGKIYAGVNNIAFTSSDPRLEEVAAFLNANAANLIYIMHHHGWAGVVRTSAGRLAVVDPSRAQLDEDGRPVETRWVVYSQCYRLTRRTDMATIRPALDMIEKYKAADDFLVSVYGTIGILSGSADLPLRPDERDKFVERMKHRWGIGAERQQIEVFSSAVNFQQLDFHAERLELPEKIREELKTIAGYFNVPYDLLPLSGQSTFANQEQAVRTFYSSCIAPLAELLLALGRDIARDETFLSTKALSWHFENVPEMQTDRSAELAYTRELVDFYQQLKDAGAELESVRENVLEQLKTIRT